MSLAKIQGLFRLTRDMEMVTTQSGVTIGKLGLACSEKYKEKETQLFIDATVFGKPAEIISQYAGSKGTQIFLTGKLQTEQWQDQQGQKRSKVSMTVEDFSFVSGQQQPQQQSYQAPQPIYQNKQGQQVSQQQYQQQMPQQPNVIDVDEDVPFAPMGLQYPLSLFVM